MYIPPIDTDIPLADFPPTFADLQDRVDAAFTALVDLECDIEVSDDDITAAQAVVTGARAPNDVLLSSPGTIVHIKAILSEYDKAVVESAAQIRTFVTNRLLLETENPDPRIRIKCLELLGKISDVGLFTEKTEITMRHRPTEELEQLLRERLTKVIEAEPVVPTSSAADTEPLDLDLDSLEPDEPR
jgi:hypothetical protein